MSRAVKRARLAAFGIVAVGVLVIGLASGGFGTQMSAEPAAQAFLIDWQAQNYTAAGALTNAAPGRVATELEGAFSQLDASQLFLTMSSVVQHGRTAVASFAATIDLAEEGRVWTYHGRFGLRQVNGAWQVQWAPSVINPSLGPGERLAVTTQFPARASVLDSAGTPLQLSAPVYVLGVWPDRLANQAATARAFANVAHLQASQVAGQIAAAPPNQFFRLATLDPSTYSDLLSSLRAVPGLVVQRVHQRLYQAEASGLVGSVGSEINPVLRADGALYLPGTTVGLTGLEQAYQRELLGTPATEVVVVNSAGAQAGVVARWPGTAGVPVRTTINSGLQQDALNALDNVSDSGEIVAVQANTGQLLAVAQRQTSVALPAAGPLAASLTPGSAFTIVSAAALLSSGQVTASTSTPCVSSFTVGGQTFTNDGTGQEKPFSTEFADGCSTAFASLSEALSPSHFAQVVKDFGIGATWPQLPVPAFSGSAPSAAGADLAADAIGQGSVRVSLLSMALVAAAVDAGTWHAPEVIQNAPDPAAKPMASLTPAALSALRGLMSGAVRSGAARAAGLSGAQVYGQVGLVHTGSEWTSWFVGYRGEVAVAVIESGKTAQLSAAALARAFFSAAGS